MTITIVHASPRSKGTSSTIARNLASKFEGAKINEINLQKEQIPYCEGCLRCVTKGMEFCPHQEKILPLRDLMLEADLLIVATPVYILHMNGQLKTFIDHFSSWFMMHRPENSMFNKQLVVVSTAAGPVYKNTIKEVAECFTYFGIPKIYSIGMAVQSMSWAKVTEKKKDEIEKQSNKIVKKVNKLYQSGKYHTPLKSKFNFAIYRKIQSKVAGDVDRAYWDERGWFGNNRPWKNAR